MAPNHAKITAVKGGDATIPAIGLGTWQLRGDACARIVEAALQKSSYNFPRFIC